MDRWPLGWSLFSLRAGTLLLFIDSFVKSVLPSAEDGGLCFKLERWLAVVSIGQSYLKLYSEQQTYLVSDKYNSVILLSSVE